MCADNADGGKCWNNWSHQLLTLEILSSGLEQLMVSNGKRERERKKFSSLPQNTLVVDVDDANELNWVG